MAHARGWCGTHYWRWKNHGSPHYKRQRAKCSVEDCPDASDAKGYCPKHYMRWKKYGDPLGSRPRHIRTDEERWQLYVDKTESCWNWTGALTTAGYGSLTKNYQRMYAHRWSYEQHVGPIPEGLALDHLCRNRSCVNPDHLEPVTIGENVRRGMRWRAACEAVGVGDGPPST